MNRFRPPGGFQGPRKPRTTSTPGSDMAQVSGLLRARLLAENQIPIGADPNTPVVGSADNFGNQFVREVPIGNWYLGFSNQAANALASQILAVTPPQKAIINAVVLSQAFIAADPALLEFSILMRTPLNPAAGVVYSSMISPGLVGTTFTSTVSGLWIEGIVGGDVLIQFQGAGGVAANIVSVNVYGIFV
jgi:hypothetical protein